MTKRKLTPLITALAALALSGCETMSYLSELRPSLRKPDVSISEPSEPTRIGESLIDAGNIQSATISEMKRRFPGPVSVQIVPSIQINDVDAQLTGFQMVSRKSIQVEVKARAMTRNTGVEVLSPAKYDCRNIPSGVTRYQLVSVVTGYDEDRLYYNKGVNPFGGKGEYEIDAERGNRAQVSSARIEGQLIPCGNGQTIDLILPFDITETSRDQSVYALAEVLSMYVSNFKSEGPGFNNAIFVANDTFISNLLLKLPYSSRRAYSVRPATRPVWSPKTSVTQQVSSYRAPVVSPPKTYPDEIIVTDTRTYKPAKLYFTRSDARNFSCKMKRKLHCSLTFSMPRGGKLSDYRVYLKKAAQAAGGRNVTIDCDNRRDTITCSLGGDMSAFSPIGFKKALYG